MEKQVANQQVDLGVIAALVATQVTNRATGSVFGTSPVLPQLAKLSHTIRQIN